MMKAIVFENENVLVQSNWDNVAKFIAEQFRIPNIGGPEIKSRFGDGFKTDENPFFNYSSGRIGKEEFYSGAAQRLGIEPTEDSLDILASSLVMLTTEENVHAIDLVRRLKQNGYKAYIYANTNPEIHHGNIQRNQYFSLFEDVMVSYSVGARKPATKAIQHILDSTKIDPDNILLIEPDLSVVVAANSIGIKSFAYQAPTPTNIIEGLMMSYGIVPANPKIRL
jgi:FMN phosphatase YigB (HAD superfamily)